MLRWEVYVQHVKRHSFYTVYCLAMSSEEAAQEAHRLTSLGDPQDYTFEAFERKLAAHQVVREE